MTTHRINKNDCGGIITNGRNTATSPDQKFRDAVINGNLEVLKRLVERGKVTDVRNSGADVYGWSSLMLAVKYGQKEVMQYLLDVGHEDTGITQDASGNTIPLLSLHFRYPEICLMYFERYPHTISMINRDGQSAINLAARYGYNDVIKFVLDHGGNINQRDIEGNTPLHHAASWGQFNTVTLLLSKGARATLVNHRGWTAVDYSYSFAMERHIKDQINKYETAVQQGQMAANVPNNDTSNDDVAPPHDIP